MRRTHGVRFLFLLLLFHAGSGAVDSVDDSLRIGVIMHFGGTLSWREEKLAIEMAVDDFRSLTGRRLELEFRDSLGDPFRAASAAISLINEHGVQAIIGPRTWRDVAFIAEVGERARIPILSFVKASPPSATERWPYLVRAARNQHSQMGAVAAIIGSWRWRKVSIVYEDVDYSATAVIPHLADALRGIGAQIEYRVPVLPSTSLPAKLELLKNRQCRVFVVHASMALATRFFAEAKRMGMMEEDYVWITTDDITSLLDSANSSTIASMQGVLGVRDHYTPQSNLTDFIRRFRRRFQSIYNEEVKNPHQLKVLQAYDAVRAISMAMNRTIPSDHSPKFVSQTGDAMKNSESLIPLRVSKHGESLLENIRQSNIPGLDGQFHFVDGEFASLTAFEIVNVVGNSYRKLGFWSAESGFSESIPKRGGSGGESMKKLGQVYWPGGPWTTPRGWAVPVGEKSLKVAVPAKAVFPDFVTMTEAMNEKPSFEGFSIDVFKKAVDNLQYQLPYDFFAFNGTYDSFIEEEQMKSYDVLVGDTSISSGRYLYVEFSQPYTPSGLVMVVPARTQRPDKSWIFLKPFTASMWVLIAAIGIYNGVIVWLIERRHNREFRGSFCSQASTLLLFCFTALLFPGGKLRSNLSRIAMLVWLFTAVVLTTNYTASLGSILTAQWIQQDPITVESLKSSDAVVGCNKGSVVGKYLEEVLGFRRKNIRMFSSENDYPAALQSGEIKAAFLRTFHAKLLMAKYCQEFTTTGPTYNVGGLGFGVSQVFPKGSSLLADISREILKLYEDGTIEKMENAKLAVYNCSGGASAVAAAAIEGLSPGSFWGLLVITVLVSTVALTLYGLFWYRREGSESEKAVNRGRAGELELA